LEHVHTCKRAWMCTNKKEEWKFYFEVRMKRSKLLKNLILYSNQHPCRRDDCMQAWIFFREKEGKNGTEAENANSQITFQYV